MSEERARMVDALAEYLGIGHKRASDALHHVWEATKNEWREAPPSWQPDLSDPGQALARRVQEALEREFEGENIFPCVVVVQDLQSRRVGLAATALTMAGVNELLMLGRGVARRAARQHGA